MFALVDCNNFFASCERLFRPDLINKPIVVLSNNDGCVIARSNEVKKYVPMGAVAYQYKEVFERHNVNVFSSNYALYGDISERVMSILKKYTPDIEVYSIDESFLKFDGFDNHFNLEDHCLKMRRQVLKWTGIPISIGLANTKALSKVANRVAKKYPKKTNGVYIINSEEKRIKALKWLKISDVWGIGRRYARKLEKINIRTAYDFTQLPEQWVQKEMTIVGKRLQRDLRGIPTLELDEVSIKKNIACTRSFEKDISDFDGVRERVSTFAIECGKKLRKQGSHCKYLIVFLKTNRHKENIKQYYNSRVITLPYSSNTPNTLNEFAIKGLKSIFRKGYKYKKAGVIVGGLTSSNTIQLSFFNNENPKYQSIAKAIDKSNKFIGRDIVKMGTQQLDRKWRMRQEHLSPNYTTRWNELMKVKAS